MKYIVIIKNQHVIAISAMLLALGLSLSAFAVHFPTSGNSAEGAKTWAQNCARCHNARDPQDLRDDQWVTSAFHMRMRAGLTGQQTRDVLTFLQDSNVPVSTEPVVFDATATSTESTLGGEAVYGQTCIACHGGNGKGTVPGAPDFTRADGPLSQSDEVLFQRTKAGYKRPGSPMAMPPKGGNSALTDADIQAVLSYMRERFTQ